ncbi:hypothetical protein CQA53_07700 [Helicobacter didelphidarum]|uniref:Uncharacterized protein n=1 Tax=Helicobacter didelphidarum TaxID=2040648 RepID=A0A3D8IHL9_9HELI|nr:glycosyltransferase family 10 [Helicobacter didelphidarum]RDU64628.1 hypothetical protein CQA53_07700 [Helicobacter didelphidarum]
MKKQVKMRIVDSCGDYEKEEIFYQHYFIQLLSKKYDIIYSDQPDFIIYGVCGSKHLDYDCVRIFYTPENIRANWDIADYSMDFDYLDYGDRHLYIPYIHTLQQKPNLSKTREIREKTKFCGFVVSNGTVQSRNIFFEKLSQYKKVDSGGKYKNNIGGRVGNKIEWLRDYKFNICFENSSNPGYLTEKLFDAYAAGCVPIYWGDTSLRCQKDTSKSIAGGGGGNP